MKHIILASVAIAFGLLFSACHDDLYIFNPDPSVETVEGNRITYFNIDPAMIAPETLENVTTANLKKGFHDISRYPLNVEHSSGTLRCGLTITHSENITDGEYLLTFSDAEGKPLRGMLRIEVENEHVVSVSEAKSSFSLRKGSGTQEDPYLIESARDFVTFLDDLRENELTNGRDVWFRQTADIELMDQSSTKPGRGYFGYSFAGHYDGDGHTLSNLYYRGAEDPEKDTRIGIFPTLLDGAYIKNLVFTGVNISGTAGDTGTVAGVVTGVVGFHDITLSGNISSPNGTNIGGLFGRIDNGWGVTAININFKMTVNGGNRVGGIAGSVSDIYCLFQNISTPDSHFSVEGNDHVGGIVGEVSGGQCSILNAHLSHVVSREDTDIRIIATRGGSGTGGIIGAVAEPVTLLNARDIIVECPVGGLNRKGSQVGGIIGSVTNAQNLQIEKWKFTSMVSGEHEVGGYFGHLSIANGGKYDIFGTSTDNYILPDDSGAGVEGVSSVGGVYGYLEGPKQHIYTPQCIRVAINVEASGDQAGGLVGKTTSAEIDFSLYNFTSTTMQVSGAKRVGGLVGFASGVTLTGGKKVDYVPGPSAPIIPSEQDFEGWFLGTVKGQSDVGGVLGRGENVTLDGLASHCTVLSLGGGNIGGVAGSVKTAGQNNVITSLVSRSEVKAPGYENVGGIIGFFDCDNFMTFYNCINYGKVTGGSNTGGIVGYFLKYWNNASSASGFKEADVNSCINKCEVTGADCVGGIFGKAIVYTTNESLYEKSIQNITRCANFATISSSSKSQEASGVGGIVGYGESNMMITYCSNYGRIVSTESHKGVGGIAGSLGRDSSLVTNNVLNVRLERCKNWGTIDSQSASSRVGGILGFMEEGPMSYLYDCLNGGDVLHKHNSDNGGIQGYIDHYGHIGRCVNRGKVEYGNATLGTHKSGCIFYHDGLYYLEGTGKSWPDAVSVSAADFSKAEKFPGLHFEDGIWAIGHDGPSPTGTFF